MIVAERPQTSPTGRYSTSRACMLLGIHRNTLAKYASECGIRIKKSKRKNTIIYTGADLQKIWAYATMWV